MPKQLLLPATAHDQIATLVAHQQVVPGTAKQNIVPAKTGHNVVPVATSQDIVAIMDWFSHYVLSWRLSNSLDTSFCLEALEEALELGLPEIFNTDQRAQFTSQTFTGRLLDAGVAISMDGRGRALDNVFIERLWRSLKYEDIYLKN